ncbi:ATP-binding protein [Paractinoplanes maris]|uniref:ATP-binding protein n=1 Tax=Paractinoplanes maris TaxID=1734446 RepID=UPI002020B297|nr:ATP-binding protein [Actinoplanes maris]
MSALRLLAFPPHSRLLFAWELHSDQDLRRIRAEVVRVLADQPHPVPEDLVQRIELVATELAGNALRHGLPPITVRLLRDDDCYLLDVSDHDPHNPPGPVVASGQFSAGGRGLHIVLSLAQELCWYKTDNAKHIWASFPSPRPG